MTSVYYRNRCDHHTKRRYKTLNYSLLHIYEKKIIERTDLGKKDKVAKINM